MERFGDRSLEVLEHEPERLLEIRGITEERLEEIKTGYIESRVMRELLLLLAPLKVTPNTALKILGHFGMKGVELLRESLFRLCKVPGFGFRRVDKIVRNSGGDLHDPIRIQGALFYTIEESRGKNGHLYIEVERLLRDAFKLLNEDLDKPLTRDQVEQQLAAMINLNVVVSSGGNIYLPHVYKQECETALRVAQMALKAPEPVNLEPVMEQVRNRLGITLSQRQAEGVEMVFRHNLSIITGGPGTGKSTILRAVVEAYRMLYPERRIALAAPTGKASRRMAETTGVEDAQTLHSLLKLHDDDSGQNKKQPLETGLLIVDETSMVDMWLAHQLFTRLPSDTKVLLVGDADQLESVGAGNVFQELIESGIVPVTVLDQIFRQAEDSRIAYNAKFINEGNSELYYGSDFIFIPATDQEEAAETVCRIYKAVSAQTSDSSAVEHVPEPAATAQSASAADPAPAVQPDTAEPAPGAESLPVPEERQEALNAEQREEPTSPDSQQSALVTVLNFPVQTGEAAAAQEDETPASTQEQAETLPQAAPSYTEDMTVEEICQVMTMEEASAIVVPHGPNKGLTMGQIAERRPSSLRFFVSKFSECSNSQKAAATLLIQELDQKIAG